MSKINIVIEVHEATAFVVHPVQGRSGKTYGQATYDSGRGCMAMRMSLEEWGEAKEDLCLARHRFYPLKFDVEVIENLPAEPAETTKTTKAKK